MMAGSKEGEAKKRGTVQDYLLARREILPNGCWKWTNHIDENNPYGMAYYAGRACHPSTLSYETFVGPIPEGMLVRHKCDYPPCINPKHLELGTVTDNKHDFMERHPKQFEKVNKLLGEGSKRGWAKLSKDERIARATKASHSRKKTCKR